MGCKICGISDTKTLTYIVNHSYPPQFIGFIVNWKASSRYVDFNQLKELLNINKKQSKYVAVLVKPDGVILEKIKDLPFDYYQIYDCGFDEIKQIKEKYNKKIITALTIENKEDVKKYKVYETISEMILFDSKGYEKSMSFNHDLLNEVDGSIKKMIAGNIKIEDVTNFKNKHYILDVSGSLESSKGVKDINKIDKFLNTVHNINS
ncbi:phosphoribosylanthranilate isomerase [Candidatus Pelagibacter sp. HIMB1506]|uniref:phosphoribosylanthranilate isomerase n=1 Tax=Candidatus Pelagibacter sp. HIMB1506 TaxID=3413337 RepID=UPI003F83CACC